MNSIQALTLDLDDTLWDIEPVLVEAEQHVYKWLTQNCPNATNAYTLQDMQKIRVQVTDEFPQHAHDFTELRKITFRRILGTTGYDEHWVDEAFEQFMAMRNSVELFPDALPALEKLAELFPIASVSNGNADLSRIGIRHHFTVTIAARDHGVAKPHRDLFLAACQALGCEPGEVLHIGDHPEHDVLGASNAGMQTIWLNRRGDNWLHDKRADAEARDLYEVLELLNVKNQNEHRNNDD